MWNNSGPLAHIRGCAIFFFCPGKSCSSVAICACAERAPAGSHDQGEASWSSETDKITTISLGYEHSIVTEDHFFVIIHQLWYFKNTSNVDILSLDRRVKYKTTVVDQKTRRCLERIGSTYSPLECKQLVCLKVANSYSFLTKLYIACMAFFGTGVLYFQHVWLFTRSQFCSALRTIIHFMVARLTAV